MKMLKMYFLLLGVGALLFTSCSKEESGMVPGGEMGTVSFNAMLAGFNKEQLVKQQVPGTGNYGLPDCPEDAAGDLSVRVRLLEGRTGNEVYSRDGQTMFEVPVIPQDDGTWITDEGADDELELPEGIYRIDYFAVYSGDTMLYIAPAEEGDYGPANYGNFVSDALPSNPFAVMSGQKKYVDVEVLCYDEHYVQHYGYLFFDFQEVDILYLCVFGNVCDDNGRHAPAVFRFDVWNYSGDESSPKGSKLFSVRNELQEGVDLVGQPYTYASPLCVQLPDRDGQTDMYFGEIRLINGDGSEELIRNGVFTEDDVEDLYISDPNASGPGSSNYYHFREDCCPAGDTPGLLNYVTQQPENCEPVTPPGECDTSYMYAQSQDESATSVAFKDIPEMNTNKWGWALSFNAVDGEYTYDLIAGAGQNVLENGWKAGEVTVTVNGTTVTVTINLDPGVTTNELQIYLDDAKPTTSAPGQYGFEDKDPAPGEVYVFEYDGDNSFWIIVHGVNCR